MEPSICPRCIANGALGNDRCGQCRDYSGFQKGHLAMADLENLSARGKLAFILAEVAAIKDAQGKGDWDDAH